MVSPAFIEMPRTKKVSDNSVYTDGHPRQLRFLLRQLPNPFRPTLKLEYERNNTQRIWAQGVDVWKCVNPFFSVGPGVKIQVNTSVSRVCGGMCTTILNGYDRHLKNKSALLLP
ncbi:hypothetical protein TNCV_76371 [Trichonephila clavipes]|nr:hypothetical protein TNCV_76371 [Trichonephila clavipes]